MFLKCATLVHSLLCWAVIVACESHPSTEGPHNTIVRYATSLRRKQRTDMISTPIFLAIYLIGLLVTLAVLVPILYRKKWSKLPIFILCIIFNILCIVSLSIRIVPVYWQFDYNDPKQLKKWVVLQSSYVAIRGISYTIPVAIILSLCLLFIRVLVSVGLLGRNRSNLLYCIGSALILVSLTTNVTFILSLFIAAKLQVVAAYLYFSLMSLYIFLAGLFFGLLSLRVGVHALRLACSKKALRRVILLFTCVFVLLVSRIPAYFVAMTGVVSRAHINFIISNISECTISFIVCILFYERIGKSVKSKSVVQQQTSADQKEPIVENGENNLKSDAVVEMEQEGEEQQQKTIEKSQTEPVLATMSVETEDKPSDTSVVAAIKES